VKHPKPLGFKSKRDFKEMRSLRNEDGTWMRLYCRSTHQKGDFLSSLSVIGEALLRRAKAVGVEGVSRWMDVKKTSGF
jgi:hypothetical protein